MSTLIFVYLILPFVLSVIVIRFLKKYGSDPVPKEIHELFNRDPIEKKFFRVIQVDGEFGGNETTATKIGDYEKQQEAVDVAYQSKANFGPISTARFFVLDDKGNILQQA